MTKKNSERAGCKDVFNAKLVSNAKYAGVLEFPIIHPTFWVPNRLIAFSKAISSKDHDQWIHFYEDDYLFERLWRNPLRYLPLLKRFNGVVLPDFSVYRDMPLTMQFWNIYRSRAIGAWLQSNGVRIIVNIRYGDCRTYSACCDGVSQGSVIAIGSHGNIKQLEDRRYFEEGLSIITQRLRPSKIIVYGCAPDEIFGKYSDAGIEIIQFNSSFSEAHSEAK